MSLAVSLSSNVCRRLLSQTKAAPSLLQVYQPHFSLVLTVSFWAVTEIIKVPLVCC
ncbi:hypothetical protein J6590_099850 [Homalodisca vitripennis]|nr:hypothetical protein J6590_099850 [Homalodisca vitripennis]